METEPLGKVVVPTADGGQLEFDSQAEYDEFKADRKEAQAGIGHNNPPETIRDRMRLERSDIFERLEQLTSACSTVPEVLSTEENAKKVSDLLKSIRAALSAAQEARKVEQKPWEDRLAETRAAFVVPITALQDARKPVKEAHDAYLQRKKDEAKRAAEAEAKKQREEAERQAKLAAEAEAARVKAEKEAAEAKEAARKAQQEREQAQQQAREAKAEAERARQEQADAAKQAELDRVKREAEAEAERKRQERQREQEKADLAAQQARDADREAKAKIDEAVRSEARGEKQERLATGKASDLSRTRSDYGAVSSLGTRLVAEIVDFPKLPKGILWGYIHRDAIQVAVNKAVASGATERDLPGVRIVEVEEGRTV